MPDGKWDRSSFFETNWDWLNVCSRFPNWSYNTTESKSSCVCSVIISVTGFGKKRNSFRVFLGVDKVFWVDTLKFAIPVIWGSEVPVEVNINRSLFFDNVADLSNFGQGGAIYSRGSEADVTINNSTFSSNDAYDGGAIYFGNQSNAPSQITHSTIKDNTATSGAGGIALSLSLIHISEPTRPY